MYDVPPPPQAEIRPTFYIDGGRFQSWNFVDWQTEMINTEKYDTYLDQFAAELEAAGTKRVTLSFSQLINIVKIDKGEYAACTPTDIFHMFNASTGGHMQVPPDGMNMIKYFATRLEEKGIQCVLAFGGEIAVPSDYDLGFSTSNPPQAVAKALADVMRELHFSGIDFDFEDSSVNLAPINGAKNVAIFLGALYEEGIPLTLTIQGDVGRWGPEGIAYGEIFQQGIPIQQMFHGINLMMYATGAGLYYIDADNPTWGLKQWIEELEKQGMSQEAAAAFLHMGFNPAINYTSPNSSAGYKYKVPKGLNNGQAAHFIWNTAVEMLGGSLQFGAPFFWDDNANYDVDANGDCKILPAKNSFQEQFFSYNGRGQK